MRYLAALAVCVCVLVALHFSMKIETKKEHRGKIVVTYWEKWTGFEGDAMRDAVKAFNESQDRIYCELLTISQIDQKLLLATSGGNPPDIAGLWSFNLNVFADNGSIIPLDDYCKKAGITREDYIPCYYDMCVHRGKIWALPSTPASLALHWNKKMFREAGLDPERPPKTMSELWEYARKLTIRNDDGGLKQVGYMPAEPGWYNWGWGYWFGGKLWDGVDKLTANSPENVKAFEWVKSYADEYGKDNLVTFRSGFGSFNSPQNAFMAGKVAMVLQGVWMHNFIKNYAPDMEWGAAPFPYPDGHPELANTTLVEEDLLAIPRHAKHPDEAFEVIKFLNSQRGMELLCQGQRKHSPLAEMSERFLRDHENPEIEVFIDLAKSPNAFKSPPLGILQEYRQEMQVAFDQVWLGLKTPQEALDRVQNRMQPKFERTKRRLEMRRERGLFAPAGRPR